MAPSRFQAKEKKREVTPYRDEPAPASLIPMRPVTPGPLRPESPVDANVYFSDRPVTPAPAEWTSYDAPINFTWVIPDELCGMGWPKSRDQVRFLVEQGIDHLVSLSPEKIPPHYAFPDLKHTLIPVEDFTGPTIAEIQKFLEICDCARRDGEAVGVHCAEGRGRTGVMCACYLIYYYDMEPWDAIRIMRRQRPGSVERKVQEETVVRFYQLLVDYGKESIDSLEKMDKQLMESQRRAQAELIRNEALATQKATMNLLSHMHSFHSKQSQEAKQERIERMRRARSMPKLDVDEEEKKNLDLKVHVQSFLQGGNKLKRVKSRRGRDTDTDNDYSDSDRRSRATTPGRALLEEVNLKPASERTIKKRLDPAPKNEEKCELKSHFRDFMRTPATVKRGRSFSQPRDKDGKNSGKEDAGSLSRKESFNEKYTREGDQVKNELENHAKRLLQRRSMIKQPLRHSDYESDNDSLSASGHISKTVDKDCRDREDSSSEEDLENSSSGSNHNNNNVIDYKPPPYRPSSPYSPKYHEVKKTEYDDSNDDNSSSSPVTSLTENIPDTQNNSSARPTSERFRSKSAVVPPTSYEVGYDVELNVEQMLEESWGPGTNGVISGTENRVGVESTGKSKSVTVSDPSSNATVNLDYFNGRSEPEQSEKEKDENNSLNNAITGSDRLRLRKYNVYSNSEYVYLDASKKIGNSKPRPFTLAHNSSQDIDKKSFSRQNSSETPEGKHPEEGSRETSKNSSGYGGTDQLEKSYSKMYLTEDKENRKRSSKRHSIETEENNNNGSSSSHNLAASFTAKTTEILNACKNDIKKLTYRKIYARTKSDQVDRTKSKSAEKDMEAERSLMRNGGQDSSGSEAVYTKYSSGSRIPNRPTTPGPYLDRLTQETKERPMSPHAMVTTSSYTPHRPTTPGPFTRQDWKRTNKKFNYGAVSKYCSRETFV